MTDSTIRSILKIASECNVRAKFDEHRGGVVLFLENGQFIVFTTGEALFELGF